MKTSYRTNLTDEQWEIIKTLIPEAKSGGRPRTVDMREVINGIFYILVAGCAWYLMPHDLPKWKTVYHYFRQWRIDGDFNWCRRLSKDYEVLPETSEAMIQVAMIRIMLRRLAT
jgi:transposase